MPGCIQAKPRRPSQCLRCRAGGAALLDAPHEAEGEQEDGRGGLAHGVERQRDQRQREVGQPDVQPRRCAIRHHCAPSMPTTLSNS